MSTLHALTVPKWGMSMEEGEITEWRVSVGDKLAVGDELVDIETSKIVNAAMLLLSRDALPERTISTSIMYRRPVATAAFQSVMSNRRVVYRLQCQPLLPVVQRLYLARSVPRRMTRILPLRR